MAVINDVYKITGKFTTIIIYQLQCGTWQCDVMIGIGSKKSLHERNQCKTFKAAEKWSLKEIKRREEKI